MQATTTNPHRVAAARLAHQILTQPSPETNTLPSPTRRLQQHLLYFDSGSRGNPGPGGSGSVIVHLGGHAVKPEIVWMASVSYAHRTTNNAAEYQGLLVGLRHAMLKQLHGLHVIGNSNLSIQQLQDRRFPRARHLQGIYTQCRLLADRLGIISWTHHLRDFNKMADELANLAMDTKKSTQVFEADLSNLPQAWTAVVGFLQRDVDNWIDIHPDQEDDGRTSNAEGVPYMCAHVLTN
ncbi:hypothetical protein PHMEG_0002850 [Phytophthora megakarya]|uniref:RNase H type-1 domain-containing protein n=1 Tax=Phytophthora megakarya TaxID=4795 RepID=A0A225WXF7_9STRA|nr:hypothetical protein PHMEG_0002850 [Phytophthora megakarya]